MKKSEFKALLKEEIKRVLTENMFEVGDEVMYMGEPHRVFSDNGYVIKLVSKKRGTKVTLNYSQAKEKISKQTDYMNENDFDQKSVNYTPGGWTPDKIEYWRSLPPGKYEVTYKPMLPLDAVKTYTLDFPEGKEFESYDEARRFYFSNQPMWFKIEDRMKNLVKVKQIETYDNSQINESLTSEEEEEFRYIEDELRYAVNSRSAINPKMVARYKVLLSKKNETSDK